MTAEASGTSDAPPFRWRMVTQSLARPYRVPFSLVLLVALVPLYIIIPELFPPRHRHLPELAIDRALPLVPVWALIYGALYLFLILLRSLSCGRTR